jgi:hypothetical protein
MRLTYDLDIVYLKSFGETYNEICKSIQVTRNNDYIYLGGERFNTATNKNLIPSHISSDEIISNIINFKPKARIIVQN